MGDTFEIHMDREALNDFPLGEYDVTVDIVTYEQDREIAWTIQGLIKPPIGHVYGYRLEPDRRRHPGHLVLRLVVHRPGVARAGDLPRDPGERAAGDARHPRPHRHPQRHRLIHGRTRPVDPPMWTMTRRRVRVAWRAARSGDDKDGAHGPTGNERDIGGVPKQAVAILATLILVAAVANLNLAVANVALPDIGKAFDASQTGSTWWRSATRSGWPARCCGSVRSATGTGAR